MPYADHPPCLRIAKHETRDHQRDKTQHQQSVLHALVGSHAQIKTMGDVQFHGFALLDGEFVAGLFQEIEEVVDNHRTDHSDDQADIEVRNPIEPRRRLTLRLAGMNGADGEARIGTPMTFAAGPGQICLVHRGGRIVLRFYGVNAVATRAIHNLDRTAAHGQTVIAVGKCLKRIARQAVAPRETHGGVTLGTHLLGEIGFVHRRGRIVVLPDVVFAVAVGAASRIQIAFGQSDGVNTGPEFLRLPAVTFRAGFRDIEPADFRAGHRGPVHRVGSVTVDAAGRFRMTCRQRRQMDRVIERRNELRPEVGFACDLRFPDVARFAEFRLRQFQFKQRPLRSLARDPLPVAGQAIGGDAISTGIGRGMGGSREGLLRRLMTTPA